MAPITKELLSEYAEKFARNLSFREMGTWRASLKLRRRNEDTVKKLPVTSPINFQNEWSAK